jgi:hypothetical protein
VPFAYYRRLTARQKRIYDRSEAVSRLEVPGAASLRPYVDAIAAALVGADRRSTERAANDFTTQLLRLLRVSLVDVKVLAKRPSNRWGELHGLYEPSDGRSRPLLTVWMRTAQRKEVVAFKTFLRTLLHEIGHHLDYELLGLEDSFHTQGFYRRESSLFHQLVPDPRVYDAAKKMASASRPHRKTTRGTTAAVARKATSPGRSAVRKPRAAAADGAAGVASSRRAGKQQQAHKEKEPVQGSLFD